jgi:5-methylcytosine-specific restriction endonuclease McrA
MGHSGQRRIRLHRWGRHGREGRLVPIKLCADPTCPEPAIYRGRCLDHARTTNRDTHRNRGIYASKRWKMLRRQVLFEQPLCACGCGHIAQDVDHILPIEHGGDPWDRTNLQALTHQCHARKTRSEQA